MSSAIEKHIIENRAYFDKHKVDKEKLWTKIESKLQEKTPKVKPINWRARIVAAASIIILFGLLAISSTYNTDTKNPELIDIDMHYQFLFSKQVDLVKETIGLSDQQKKEFLTLIDELEKEYKVLRNELDNEFNSDLILQAIVTNYKKRIDLIENFLKRVNKTKNVTDNHEYLSL